MQDKLDPTTVADLESMGATTIDAAPSLALIVSAGAVRARALWMNVKAWSRSLTEERTTLTANSFQCRQRQADQLREYPGAE